MIKYFLILIILSPISYLYSTELTYPSDLYIEYITTESSSYNQKDSGYWIPLGGFPPLQGRVNAIAVDDNKLVIGGQFTYPGTNTNYIAQLNNGIWESVGEGLNDYVYSIAFCGSDIYAGGAFTHAGGNPNADYIARWNGTSWEALGEGLNNKVWVIVTWGDYLYVGGEFTDAGGDPNADYIAKWNGSSWESLGEGLNNTVRAIEIISDSDIYAGGLFTNAGGDTYADYIARWNGSNWSSLGYGIECHNEGEIVYAIESSDNGSIYVAGQFARVSGISNTSCIARWDSNSWSSLGGGIPWHPGYPPIYPYVISIACLDDDVYIGGSFDQVGNVNADNFAKWNGSYWSVIGDPPLYYWGSCVNEITAFNNELYIGGIFRIINDSISAFHIAKWDGVAWGEVDDIGFTHDINCVYASGSDVYVGGQYVNAFDIKELDCIGRLDSSYNWHCVGDPHVLDFGYKVNTINSYDNRIYVGGAFTDMGSNVFCDYIAEWDGANWNAVDYGLNQEVRVIVVEQNGDLYIGGNFYYAGGILNANRIVKWDGSNWIPLGVGINGGYDWVNAIEIGFNGVYAGGRFLDVGGDPNADYIAIWDGSNWSSVVNYSINDDVYSIIIFDDNLYIGGAFTDASGNPNVDYIAVLNGTFWGAFGNGLNSSVLSMAVYDNEMYIGGTFTDAGGDPDADYVAKWNGTSWEGLGGEFYGGYNLRVNSITISQDGRVYVGGTFTNIDGMPCAGFACWQPVQVGIGEEEISPKSISSFNIYPNPSSELVVFSLHLKKESKLNLAIYSVDGRRLLTLMDENLSAGCHDFPWDGRDETGRILPNGTYFCRFQSENEVGMRKFSIIR